MQIANKKPNKNGNHHALPDFIKSLWREHGEYILYSTYQKRKLTRGGGVLICRLSDHPDNDSQYFFTVNWMPITKLRNLEYSADLKMRVITYHTQTPADQIVMVIFTDDIDSINHKQNLNPAVLLERFKLKQSKKSLNN